MAFKYGFFNSNNGDRTYTADDFNDIFEGLIPEKGVLQDFKGTRYHFDAVGSATATGASYNITIRPGKGWIKNYWFVNSSNMVISTRNPDSRFNRKDTLAVKLESDNDSRRISLIVVTGGQSSFPELIDDEENGIYYMPLANITRTWVASTTGVPEHWNVTIDILVGTSVCPYIATIAMPTIEVDSALSNTSTNPVQNKVVKAAVDSITPPVVDSEMSDTSTNPVQNKIVKAYIDTSIENIEIEVDSHLSDTSTNPVENQVVKEAVDGKVSKGEGSGIAIGDGSQASSSNNISIGINAKSTASKSIAIGYGADTGSTTSNSDNIAIGNTARITSESGNGKIAIGHGAVVSAEGNAFAMQIGYGNNPSPGTIQIMTRPFYNTSNGKIFNDRLDIDDAMSDESEKPVQNKVIKEYVDSFNDSFRLVKSLELEEGSTSFIIDSDDDSLPFSLKEFHVDISIPVDNMSGSLTYLGIQLFVNGGVTALSNFTNGTAISTGTAGKYHNLFIEAEIKRNRWIYDSYFARNSAVYLNKNTLYAPAATWDSHGWVYNYNLIEEQLKCSKIRLFASSGTNPIPAGTRIFLYGR